MHVADTLSRAPVHEDFSGQDELAESAQEVLATEIVREGISDPTLDEVRMLTSTDQAMQKLMDVVKNGWPDQQGQIDNEVRPYFHHRDELTIENGILFKRRPLRYSHGYEDEHIKKTPCDTHGCRVKTAPGEAACFLAWVEWTSKPSGRVV